MAEESLAWSPTALKCLLEKQDLVSRWYVSETFDITKTYIFCLSTDAHDIVLQTPIMSTV